MAATPDDEDLDSGTVGQHYRCAFYLASKEVLIANSGSSYTAALAYMILFMDWGQEIRPIQYVSVDIPLH